MSVFVLSCLLVIYFTLSEMCFYGILNHILVAYSSVYYFAHIIKCVEHRLYADDGQDVEGLPTEGVEITCFHLVYHLLLSALFFSY